MSETRRKFDEDFKIGAVPAESVHGCHRADPRAGKAAGAWSPLGNGAAGRGWGEPDPAQPRPARVRCCRRWIGQ